MAPYGGNLNPEEASRHAAAFSGFPEDARTPDEQRSKFLARRAAAIKGRESRVVAEDARRARINEEREAAGLPPIPTLEEQDLVRRRAKDVIQKREEKRQRRRLGLSPRKERIPSLEEVRRVRDASQVSEDDTGAVPELTVPRAQANPGILTDNQVYRVTENGESRFFRWNAENRTWTPMAFNPRGGPDGTGAFEVDPSVPAELTSEEAEESMADAIAFYTAPISDLTDAQAADTLRRGVSLMQTLLDDPSIPVPEKLNAFQQIGRRLDNITRRQKPREIPQGKEAIEQFVHEDPLGRVWVTDPKTGKPNLEFHPKAKKDEDKDPASVEEWLQDDRVRLQTHLADADEDAFDIYERIRTAAEAAGSAFNPFPLLAELDIPFAFRKEAADYATDLAAVAAATPEGEIFDTTLVPQPRVPRSVLLEMAMGAATRQFHRLYGPALPSEDLGTSPGGERKNPGGFSDESIAQAAEELEIDEDDLRREIGRSLGSLPPEQARSAARTSPK